MVVIIILKKPVAQLLGRLESVRHGESEAKFSKELNETLKQAEEIREYKKDSGFEESIERDLEDYEKLAELSPRAVIIESWLKLEKSMTKVVETMGVTSTVDVYKDCINLMLKEGIDDKKISLLRRLRNLRNYVIHSPEITLSKNNVIYYANLILRYSAVLDGTSESMKRDK